MSRNTKKAERALTDATKFPVESCREKIARRFGLDAVALSGPCEGQPLCECVCDQLSSRWDNIKDRFAGNESKVVRLAVKMAESWASDNDDTGDCAKLLQDSYEIEKEAADGIANYLKSYHIEKAAMDEMDSLMDEVDKEDDDESEVDDLGLDDGDDDGFGGDDDGDDDGDDFGGGDDDEGLGDDEGGNQEPGELEPADGGMVSVELPVTVVEELLTSLEGYEHDVANVDSDPSLEIIEEPAGLPGVPGEPAGMEGAFPGDQFVETENGCGGGRMMASPGREQEMGMGGGAAPAPAPAPAGGAMMAAPGRMEKERGMGMGMMPMASSQLRRAGSAPKPSEPEPAPEAPKAASVSDEETQIKEAAMQLRAGRLRRIGQNVLKIGPEMSINNTDQQAGGHNLGDAKDKGVEDPKALEDGNVHNEAYTANDNNFSDGKTMGHEQKFDPHEITEDEVSGGQSSLLGKDESFPEGGPDVPAGSSPIGGEQWEGGDVSTKGTVIASLTRDGIKAEIEGQRPVLAKMKIDFASQDMIEAVAKVKYEGDLRDFAIRAREAAKAVQAKTECKDGIPHTDTSKLEGEKFTNDAKKAPEEGGAHVYYEKSGSDNSDSEHPETNTSKLEGDKFTNDAEKKPYSDEEAKKAASRKATKTAADSDVGADKEKVVNKHQGDKAVEDPKALDDGNIHPDGYTANGTTVSAGDGSVQGNEKKFEAHEVTKDEVSGGSSSLMGKDESLPEGKAEVPAGGPAIQQEELEGGDVSSKGTVIAGEDESSQKRAEAEEHWRLKEARLKAASPLAADMLRNGDITEDEYQETLERLASLPIPAIQTLAVTMRKAREKADKKVRAAAEAQQKTASLSRPIVYSSTKEEPSLVQKISELWSSNKLFDPDNYDERGRRKF